MSIYQESDIPPRLHKWFEPAEIGREETLEEYLDSLVEVFSEVWRVLKDGGCCWINMGDTFREKELMGVPWKLAFALGNDGWILRSDCIWSKKSPMCSSVKDRPTVSHEYVFMFVKTKNYFYDIDAERMPLAASTYGREKYSRQTAKAKKIKEPYAVSHDHESDSDPKGRNLWTVWNDIPQSNYTDPHFAVFSEELPARCLRLGTSDKGQCPDCGLPWKRVSDHSYVNEGGRTTNGPRNLDRRDESAAYDQRLNRVNYTIGWKPSCECDREPIPQVCLDPFSGAGTTGLVAKKMGLRYVGLELNPDYAEASRKRISKPCTDGVPKPRKPLPNQMELF